MGQGLSVANFIIIYKQNLGVDSEWNTEGVAPLPHNGDYF